MFLVKVMIFYDVLLTSFTSGPGCEKSIISINPRSTLTKTNRVKCMVTDDWH